MDDSTATPATAATATASAAAVAADGPLKRTTAAPQPTANVSKTSVKLVIKSSNQQYDDQIIESDLLWTVRRLKAHLSIVYPSKPPVAEQKLIYSGQLLTDAVQLKDVIRSYKDVYTQNHIIHLVYLPKNLTPNLSRKPPVAPKVGPAATTMNQGRNTEGLRQRITPTVSVGTTTPPQPALINNTAATTTTTVTATATTTPIGGIQQIQQIQQTSSGSHQNNFINPENQQFTQYGLQFGMNPPGFMNQLQYMQNLQMNCFHPTSAANVLAAHQMALYNAWMQQVYSQYMDQMMQMSSTGQDSDQMHNFRQGFINTMNNPMNNPMMNSLNNPLINNPMHYNPMINNPMINNPMNSLTEAVIPQNMIGPFQDISSSNQVVGGPAASSTPVVASPIANQNDPVAAAAALVQQAREAQQRHQQNQEQAAGIDDGRRFPNMAQEDADNRDWLDSFLSITRLAIFLTILYFNTSPIRCLIVTMIGSSIYLYHIGVIRIRHERNNNNINRNNNAQPGVEQQDAAIRQGVQEVQEAAHQLEQQHAQDHENNSDDPPPNDDTVDGNHSIVANNTETKYTNGNCKTTNINNEHASVSAALAEQVKSSIPEKLGNLNSESTKPDGSIKPSTVVEPVETTKIVKPEEPSVIPAAEEPVEMDDNTAVDSVSPNIITAQSSANNDQQAIVEDNLDDEENASVISIVRTFVVTFFTSLLPETPAL